MDPAPDPAADEWGNEWGSPPEVATPGTPPPPPPMGMQGEKPSPTPESVAALGRPPSDTVEAAKWAYQLHMELAYDAMMDDRMTPSQRRKEVRVTLAGASKHMMDALRYDTMTEIEKDRAELERKARGKANAKMVPASGKVPAAAKIIPIRPNG